MLSSKNIERMRRLKRKTALLENHYYLLNKCTAPIVRLFLYFKYFHNFYFVFKQLVVAILLSRFYLFYFFYKEFKSSPKQILTFYKNMFHDK